MNLTSVSARPVGNTGWMGVGSWGTAAIVGAVALVVLGVLAVVLVVKWVWGRGVQPQSQPLPQPRPPTPLPPPSATPPVSPTPTPPPTVLTPPPPAPISVLPQLTSEHRTVIKQLIPLFNEPIVNATAALALEPKVVDLHPLEFLRAIIEDQTLWLPMGDVAFAARVHWESKLTTNLNKRKQLTQQYQVSFLASARQHFKTVTTLDASIQKLQHHIASENGAALLAELSALIFLTEEYAVCRLEALMKELSGLSITRLGPGSAFQWKTDAFEKQADPFHRTIAMRTLYQQGKIRKEIDDLLTPPKPVATTPSSWGWFGDGLNAFSNGVSETAASLKKSGFLTMFTNQVNLVMKDNDLFIRVVQKLNLDPNTVQTLHKTQQSETLLIYFLTGHQLRADDQKK